MKFISVRDLRGNAARVWRELPEAGEMVITNNGRPVAVLASVDEDSVEQSLTSWRRARAIQAIAEIQKDSVRHGTDRLTLDDINTEIAKARKARRKTA